MPCGFCIFGLISLQFCPFAAFIKMQLFCVVISFFLLRSAFLYAKISKNKHKSGKIIFSYCGVLWTFFLFEFFNKFIAFSKEK